MATYDDFAAHMRQSAPWIDEEKIRAYWEQYSKKSSQTKPEERSSLTDLLGGYAETIGLGVAGAQKFLGWEGDIPTGIQGLRIPGSESTGKYWKRKAEENPPNPEFMGRSILDEPGMLLDPGYWGSGLTRMVPQVPMWFLGGVAGGPVGAGAMAGALETLPEYYAEADNYGPVEGRARALASMAGVGALNTIPFAKALGPAKSALSRIGQTSLAEGLTEWAEEPVQALAFGRDPLEAAYYGANVAPLAALTGGLMGGASEAYQRAQPSARTEDQVAYAQKAYHGTPHQFERFDIGQIGTGEGNQTFGHGIYLAENPETARSYVAESKGNLYAVDVPDASVASMLEWDKTLAEQPEAMKRLGVDPENRSRLPNRLTPEMTGQQVYSALSRGQTNLGVEANKEAASRYLLSKGIRGIKYLDAGSRAEGEGSRNFVVFDDNDITITDRYKSKVKDFSRDIIEPESIPYRAAMYPGDLTARKMNNLTIKHAENIHGLGVKSLSTIPAEQTRNLSSVLGDVNKMGVPSRLLDMVDSVFAYGEEDSRALMTPNYNQSGISLGLNRELLDALGKDENVDLGARVAVAHEFGHVADVGMSRDNSSFTWSHPDFTLDPLTLQAMEGGKIQAEGLGPILQEALDAFQKGEATPGSVAGFLAYPLMELPNIALKGRMATAYGSEPFEITRQKLDEDPELKLNYDFMITREARRIQAEVFAQLWAMYHSAPNLMQKELPKAYKFVKSYQEKINEGRTVDDARTAIQQAFWAHGTQPGAADAAAQGRNQTGGRPAGGNRAWRSDTGVSEPAGGEGPVGEGSLSAKQALELDKIGNLSAKPTGVIGESLDNEQYDLMQDISKMFSKERRKASRGKLNLAELDTMAASLGMNPEELARRSVGSAWNAEKIRAGAQIVKARSRKLKETALKVLETGSNEDKSNFIEDYYSLAEVLIPFQGVAAEAGRALMAFRGATQGIDLKELGDLVNDPNLGIAERARMISGLEGPGQVARQVGKEMTPTWSDKLMELWINSLLSGPQTQAVNLLSNSLVDIFSVAEHAIGSVVSRIKGDKIIPMSSVLARAHGMMSSIPEALKVAKTTFQTEQEFGESKIEANYQKSIKGTKGRIIRIPGRALSAGDAFYKVVALRGALAEVYNRNGRAKGLEGKELQQYIQDGVHNPSDHEYQAAMKQAGYYTFTNNLGKMGQSIMSLARSHPLIRIVFPFIRTPTNIVKYAAERTPLALAMKETRDNLLGRNGDYAQDMQIARVAVGSSVMMFFAYLAAQGMVSGGGPSDPKERRLKYQQGWMPYSIKIGEKWYAYGRLEPLGMLVGIGADLVETGAAAMHPEDAERIGSMLVSSVSKNITSKTWLRGLSELINAATDPDRYGERYIQNLFSTVIPTLSAQIARVDDPTLRQSRSMMDAMMNRIPGQREKLPPVVDLYGRPVVREGGLGPDIISPVYTSTEVNDPVAKEFERLRFHGGYAGKTVMGQELTQEQRNEYQRMIGQMAQQLLLPLIDSPRWGPLPDDVKRDIIDRIYQRVRKEVKPVMAVKMAAGG